MVGALEGCLFWQVQRTSSQSELLLLPSGMQGKLLTKEINLVIFHMMQNTSASGYTGNDHMGALHTQEWDSQLGPGSSGIWILERTCLWKGWKTLLFCKAEQPRAELHPSLHQEGRVSV